MKKKKLLYIANGNSIHDIKWISFFSDRTDEYTCFLMCDTLCELTDQTKSNLAKLNIQLVPQIEPLSIKSPLRSWKSIRQFKKTIGKIQPDIIHVLFATPNALWLNFSKTPSIVTTRGSDILRVIPELLTQSGIKKLYFKYLFYRFKKAFEDANYCTGTSQAQLDSMYNYFSIADAKLIRTGVDTEKIMNSSYDDILPRELYGVKYIISPRFMSPIYRIDLQLETIEKLSDAILGDYTFAFVRGLQFDQDYYSEQLKTMNHLKRERGLKFIVFDYLTQDQIVAVIKHASLCIMTPESDGTPNSALEAMAAKCPLILPNLPYDNDLFENSCIQLKSCDTQELKETIEFALTTYNPALISKGFETVLKLGNRTNEMKKIAFMYAQIIQNSSIDTSKKK